MISIDDGWQGKNGSSTVFDDGVNCTVPDYGQVVAQVAIGLVNKTFIKIQLHSYSKFIERNVTA